MLKKIALIVVIAIAAAVFGWSYYYRDGELKPVSKAEGKKLLAQVLQGIEKNQTGIKNGCGKVTEKHYLTFPDEGSAERKTTCYTVFADEDYKVRVVGSSTHSKGPEQSFGEKLKQFGRNLIKPGSVKTTPGPSFWEPELVRKCIYSGNKEMTTKYVPGKKRARISSVNYDDWQNDCRAVPAFIMSRNYMEEPSTPYTFRTTGAIVFENRILEPVVVGRQRLGRDECLVVEQKTERRLIKNTRSHVPVGSSSHRTILWICPRKGYCALRTQQWSIDPAYNKSNKEMLDDVTTMDVREYKPGVWGIAEQEIAIYSITPEGLHYRQSLRTITYDPNFQLNIPKNKLDFKLKLPKGTRVTDEVKSKSYVVK